jgi:tetratricopeptide (TPR) repeat protein
MAAMAAGQLPSNGSTPAAAGGDLTPVWQSAPTSQPVAPGSSRFGQADAQPPATTGSSWVTSQPAATQQPAGSFASEPSPVSAPAAMPNPAEPAATPTAGAAPAGASTSAVAEEARPPSQADELAAASLRDSALELVYAPSTTESRAGRLVAVANYSWKLAPNDPQTATILSDIYQGRDELASALEMTQFLLKLRPKDFALLRAQLRLGVATRPKGDDQVAFLGSFINDETRPPAIRSEAAIAMNNVLTRMGQKDRAQEMMATALKLDELNPTALQASMPKDAPPDGVSLTRLRLGYLKGSPRYFQAAKDLAETFAGAGLSEPALKFLACLWQANLTGKDSNGPPAGLVDMYLNAMLDAGQYETAVRMFEPFLEKYPEDTYMASLMAEAYSSSGQTAKADAIIAALADRFDTASSAKPLSPGQLWSLSMFYAMVAGDHDKALAQARKLASLNETDEAAQELIGVAELRSGQADLVTAGRQRLEKLKRMDPLMAAALAASYLAAGDSQAGTDSLQKGLAVRGSNFGTRLLRKLAEQYKIDFPPHKDAQALQDLLGAFDMRYLDMAVNPQKYLAVTLKPLAERTMPGQPILIEATLSNIGPLDIPLGDWGLINPRMGFVVSAAPLTREKFTGLPMVIWPAPRSLAPGESVSATVRLDVAGLGQFLGKYPLEEITLKVAGLIDPAEQGFGGESVSSLPDYPLEPVTLVRSSLMGSFDREDEAAWGKAYRRALSVLYTRQVRGDLPIRMEAMRQLGSLITMAREIDLSKVRLPDALKGVVDKRIFLAMLQKALTDPSEVVRAEILTALQDARLDDAIIKLVLPAAQDTSPLVRFRAAELLGASRKLRQEEVMNALAKDSDKFVAMMAGLFARTETAK